jgi:rod shape-determining protein MreC
MLKRGNFISYFIIFLIFSIALFGISKTGVLNPVTSIFQGVFFPLQEGIYNSFSRIVNLGESPDIKLLRQENIYLSQKIVNQNNILQDNKALRDQFNTQTIKSANLISAQIVGAPGFLPGVSTPETLIIGKGETDGVKIGQAVVYKDNLIGQIFKTSSFVSVVNLVSNSSFSFTAKTLKTQSPGVIKGQGGGQLILDNVLLSETLEKGDLVLTKGDMSENGTGIPQDLVVGSISSISKNPSELFQKAEVKSFLDFTNLNEVFIITNP